MTKLSFLSAPLLFASLTACSSSTSDGPSNDPYVGGQAGQVGSSSGGSSSSGGAGAVNAAGGSADTGGGSGVGGGQGMMDSGAGVDMPHGPPPEFGPNVLIFDPTMPMATIQGQIDAVSAKQASSQFGTARYAF